MSKEIFEKLGIDISKMNGSTRGFFRGLITEYKKNVDRFNSKSTQDFFNIFITAFMLEYHKAYENFDIRVPYRIKSPKSVFDKVLDYLVRTDKSEYSYNQFNEYQGKLKDDIKDMFAITIVACNRTPTLYSNDPEIKELIEEQKRNHALLGEMQKFKLRITNSEFSGTDPNTYNYSCSKEEYYLNCMILLNRIKTLSNPDSKGLIKKYDDILERIKNNVPEEFYRIANSVTKDPEIIESLNTADKFRIAHELTHKFIENSNMTQEEVERMGKPIDENDVKIVDFIDITDDFTARIHDKLDLAILTKQVYSVFENSKLLKKFDVSIIPDSLKKKRAENGYVSNFVYLDTPFGKVEVQLQSQHENREGNYGYSAHADMRGKSFKEFDIPKRGDKDGLKTFRACVEFVSAKKFLAQYDNSEPNRILTQVYGKYQNYKSTLTQVKKGSEQDIRLKQYFGRLYSRRNEIFPGEARQESVECFMHYDIDEYFKSKEYKKIMEMRKKAKEEQSGNGDGILL